jgi:hypothetical protein
MHSTERLAELIRKKEIGALLKLLAVKQQLIAALQTLECELKPYYVENPETRAWNSVAARAECAQMANDCNVLLEEIVALEKQGAEQMDARKNEVAQQLQQVHAAAHVRGAYQAQRRMPA